MYRLILPFVILLPIFGFAQLPGKFIVQPDQRFVIDIEFSNKLVQQAEGQAIDFVVAGRATHQVAVLTATPDSSMLEHRAGRIRFEFEGMGARRAFDSDNEEDMADELGDFFAPHKKPFTVTTDSRGLIQSVYGIREKSVPDPRLLVILDMVDDLTLYSTPPIPGEASCLAAMVPAGTVPGGQWTSGNADSGTVFTLQSVKDSKYTIAYQQVLRDSATVDINGIKSITRYTIQKDGTVVADVATGIVYNHNYTTLTNGIREAMGTKIPFSSRKNVVVRIRPE